MDEKKEFKLCNVMSQGDKIILPEGMSHEDAITWIKRYSEENDRMIAINEAIEAFPADGAYALTKALSMKYGWTSMVPTPGFFSSKPPAMFGIPVNAAGDTVQVPWGRLEIPKVAGYIQPAATIKDGRWIFMISGEIKRRHEAEIKEISELTRKLVKTESLYKGKAIKMKFDKDADPQSGFNISEECPTFIDTSAIDEEELILNDLTARQIDVSIFTPLRKTEQCRKCGIPLKRGVLCEGAYGTGKSLAAYVTAKIAQENGWTFVYLNAVSQLQKAIFFAKQYSPAVVFAEDIDRVLSGPRTEGIDAILNTIDGVDTKNSEIITILTTNHIEHIAPPMLRPGRLDAIISFERPDPKSVERLIRLYARGYLADNVDIRACAEKLDGQIPAVIREMIERAKLAAVSRQKGPAELRLDSEDLEIATVSMLRHVEYLQQRPFDAKNTPLGAILDIVGTGIGQKLKEAHIDATAMMIKAKATMNGMNN